MINKNKIFDLFSNTPENKVEVKKQVSIDEFMNSPFAKIGMFCKLIINHNVFHQKLEKFLKQENPSYNVENTKEAADFGIFNRSYQYISKIDIDNPNHLKALVGFDPKIFNKALNHSILYFETNEEYEKCAHLFKIQQIVKEI